MKLSVDLPQRHAKMRAHTATHLLHHALNTLLGSTKQAGSLVDEDYLRFDFAAQSPLSDNDIQKIEQDVNARIRMAVPVETTEMNYSNAINTGAKAFFEDKYGDIVRVVSIQQEKNHIHSIELCGGTHVQNTEHVGAFVVLGQESVASGIRRIIALTGPAVAEHVLQQRQYIAQIAQKLDCQPKQLEEKAEKITKYVQELQDTNARLQHRYFSQIIEQLTISKHNEKQEKNSQHLPGVDFVINVSSLGLNDEDLKPFASIVKQELKERVVLMYTNSGSYVLCGSSTHSAKSLIQQRNVSGGGNDQYVQGKDTSLITKIFAQ